jgi:hypothetical protein
LKRFSLQAYIPLCVFVCGELDSHVAAVALRLAYPS